MVVERYLEAIRLWPNVAWVLGAPEHYKTAKNKWILVCLQLWVR